ncbi:MAG: AbiV family abortive infection protein [Pseudomonadota bacterium]
MSRKADKVSLDLVNNGIGPMIENAVRLYHDALLLYENNRYPTACSVAILAVEELGKILCYMDVAKANPDNEREQKKALMGHNKKLTILEMLEQFSLPNGEIQKAYVELKNIAKNNSVNDLKQWGLYVDLDNNNWLTPSNRVKKIHAKCLLTCAGHLLVFFNSMPISVS